MGAKGAGQTTLGPGECALKTACLTAPDRAASGGHGPTAARPAPARRACGAFNRALRIAAPALAPQCLSRSGNPSSAAAGDMEERQHRLPRFPRRPLGRQMPKSHSAQPSLSASVWRMSRLCISIASLSLSCGRRDGMSEQGHPQEGSGSGQAGREAWRHAHEKGSGT